MRMSFPCARYTELRNEALQTEEVRKFQADNAVSLWPFREISGVPPFFYERRLISGSELESFDYENILKW